MDSLSSANPLHGPIDHEVLLLGFLIHYQEDFEKLPAVFFERKVKIFREVELASSLSGACPGRASERGGRRTSCFRPTFVSWIVYSAWAWLSMHSVVQCTAIRGGSFMQVVPLIRFLQFVPLLDCLTGGIGVARMIRDASHETGSYSSTGL